MIVENKLRELLVPVFGVSSIEEIQPENSLVNDLGADSLDFVEIIHLIEVNFKVTVNAGELIAGGNKVNVDELFKDGRLTSEGVKTIQEKFSIKKDFIHEGMTKIDLFSLLTVKDLAEIINNRINEGSKNV